MKFPTLAFIAIIASASAFTSPDSHSRIGGVSVAKSAASKSKSTSLFPTPRKQSVIASSLKAATTALSPNDGSDSDSDSYEDKPGFFAFKTKYGYLNPFAIYYGVTSILLGLPWFVALTLCQISYKINKNFDKMRKLPVYFSQIWGILLLRLTRSYPKIENMDKLKAFYKQNRAGMFVANHNSWMDIPFLGITVGMRNYKIISKAELFKVPILGKSIAVGGHVMVDRSSRKSQLKTFKSGMKWLKNGVHLCAFPEGTRSKTGRLLPFKNGAFKMAHKVGAPVVPMSIVASGKAHPPNWMFPRKSAHGTCKVIVHDPIESEGKTEAELADAIREAIISGLPEDQHPLN